MPFQIIRNDITKMQVDAIVNAANHQPLIGYGVDFSIYHKAGPELLKARQQVGNIPYGDAAITPSYNLSNTQYIIHTVSPIWQDGNQGELELLANCYRNSLHLALNTKCISIAFPLLSSGSNGFPKDFALRIAIQTISSFLMEHDMDIYLVVYDKNSYSLSEKLFSSVQSYIDDTYIEEHTYPDCCFSSSYAEPSFIRENSDVRRNYAKKHENLQSSGKTSYLPSAPRRLEDLLKEIEETFSGSLIRIIDQKGLKDPDVYKKANVDRKLFSKIKNNPNYKPSKATALAFAIALKLSLDETKDFIGKAGYALTHTSKFDIILEYFILEENYNIFEINEVLFAFDQPLIGAF